MLTKDGAIKRVKRYTDEIIKQGVNLNKVIMYGSFAKGTQHKWSDIDVALVADEFIGAGFIDRALFSRVGIKDPYVRIEVKTYPTDYFQKGDPFIEEIKNTGIEII